MPTVPWRQAVTAWGWPSDLYRGENNSHHQSRDGAVLYSFCIDPWSFSNRMGFNPTRSRLHPFAMVITAFDMGSHDVLQVLGRSGRVNIARTPPPPPPSAKESKSALRTPFEPGCVLHERGRIAACRRIAAEGDLVINGKRCYADPPRLHTTGGAVFS